MREEWRWQRRKVCEVSGWLRTFPTSGLEELQLDQLQKVSSDYLRPLSKKVRNQGNCPKQQALDASGLGSGGLRSFRAEELRRSLEPSVHSPRYPVLHG